jgi:hypothetical protein
MVPFLDGIARVQVHEVELEQVGHAETVGAVKHRFAAVTCQ